MQRYEVNSYCVNTIIAESFRIRHYTHAQSVIVHVTVTFGQLQSFVVASNSCLLLTPETRKWSTILLRNYPKITSAL